MSSCKNGKLLDDVRRIMRMKHYSIHTERTYCDWIRQFVKFHKLQDRDSLLIASESKIEDFFSYLAIQRKEENTGLYFDKPKSGLGLWSVVMSFMLKLFPE